MTHLNSSDCLSRVRTRSHSQTSSDRRPRALDSGSTTTVTSRYRITIDDDDDDVQILSPRSAFSQARSLRRSCRNVLTPELDDSDLELRLGLSGTKLAASSQKAVGGTQKSRISKVATATIDLTSGNDDEVILLSSQKRKAKQISPEPSKDIQLTCAICMDAMKEETSTVCGHIFCRSCIVSAIQAQKRCPTCRRKLKNSNIHRIYLPNSTT